jgi:peptide/nickel transport system substrate-binding protein
VSEQVTGPTMSSGAGRVIMPLIHPGLSVKDPAGALRPVLAERMPSLENGLWKLFSDGRMETTWKIREGAQWHDGVPFTADDLLFSLQVGREPELPGFHSVEYAEIDEVTAPDPRTLTVTWKQPYSGADLLYASGPALRPLPRHLLEQAYREDKASFLDLRYWTQDFVGTGPYRVREWTLGLGVRLEANPEFVLGRPKIDEIEIRYIPDSNTMSANLLAGVVDVTPQVGSIDTGLQLREQWRDGAVVFNLGSGLWNFMVPQFIDPRPAIVGDVRFRRALVHSIDRQEMVDTLRAGMSPVPHSMLEPNRADYREIEASVPRYGYDPRRAAELLQEIGYARGTDRTYRDPAGQRLEVDVRTTGGEEGFKAGAAIADSWQRLGVGATAVPARLQGAQDLEYGATFPAFLVRSGTVLTPRFYHSSYTLLPSNDFRGAPGNWSRYMNPELDALIETHQRTVPMPERTDLLGQIARHMADQVTIVGLAYPTAPGAISKRLLNVSTQWPISYITWNAHEWDVTRAETGR